jgi:AAA+ superfamily predicted ATPase
MDQALLSRFSQEIYFRLPNLSEIHNIFSHYLPECSNIAEEMFVGFEGKSGRDISNVAKDIARKYLQIRIVEKQDTTDIKKILETYLLEAVQQQKIIATEESKVLGK